MKRRPMPGLEATISTESSCQLRFGSALLNAVAPRSVRHHDQGLAAFDTSVASSAAVLVPTFSTACTTPEVTNDTSPAASLVGPPMPVRRVRRANLQAGAPFASRQRVQPQMSCTFGSATLGDRSGAVSHHAEAVPSSSI